MIRKLSLEETKKCLRAWREFSDKEALEVLMVCNGGLVVFFVKKFFKGRVRVSSGEFVQVSDNFFFCFVHSRFKFS